MVLYFMRKYDNFSNSLNILKNADFQQATENEVYRMGIIGQFNLTFELAWKSLQAVLQKHSVAGSETGSPRDILKLAYKIGYLSNSDIWLLMMKKRNLSIHVYDSEEEIDELIVMIRDSFIPAFIVLENLLKKKIEEIKNDSWN